MSEDQLNRIHDIANRCKVPFGNDKHHFQDGEVDSYQFNYLSFLEISECLKHAEYFLDKWKFETKLSEMTKTAIKYEDRIEEFLKEVKDLKATKNSLSICVTELKKDLYESDVARIKSLVTITDHEFSALTKDRSIRSLRSLRSQLGHAKRKIKRLT